MNTILMMSAKMVPLGLLKMKVSSNKGYGVMILFMTSSTKVYHGTQILL